MAPATLTLTTLPEINLGDPAGRARRSRTARLLAPSRSHAEQQAGMVGKGPPRVAAKFLLIGRMASALPSMPTIIPISTGTTRASTRGRRCDPVHNPRCIPVLCSPSLRECLPWIPTLHGVSSVDWRPRAPGES